MFSNYFKTAWRNLFRNKIFSVVNIMGLALGMACSLLILLWVNDERSVDAFHANGPQLYHVYERSQYDGKVEAGYPTQGLLAEELKRVIPGIKYASGLEYASAPGTLSTIEAGGKVNKAGGAFTGEDFFSMFSYPLLSGTATDALHTTGTIAISRKLAEEYYGTVSAAMGKPLLMDNKEELKVSAVFEDLPLNSTVRFDYFRPWVDFVRQNEWVHNWGNTDPLTWVQLQPGVHPASINASIKDFIYRYKAKDKSMITELVLQPYAEKYLHSNFKNGQIEGGRIEYVRLFTLLAIFVLLIACINFMNLSTARAGKRAREVGLRKVVGAARGALVLQFIGESVLLACLAGLLALALATALLPLFNALTGKQLLIPVGSVAFWISFSALLLITGLVAGSYPAFFLSSMNAVRVLKGTLKFSWTDTLFRKGLVVFQFALSMILVVGMIVIYRQMDYIQSRNLGYDRENLIYIPIEGELVPHYNLFKEAAGGLSSVAAVSKMRNSPTVIEHHTGGISWPGKDPNLMVSFADAVVGYDFSKTMKLQFAAGRDFSRDFGSDSTAYLINETAAKRIGYASPVGKPLVWGNHPGQIVGVVRDFHFNSMHAAIEPLIVRLDEKWSWGTILVRVKAGQTRQAIAGLQRICRTINPRFPFTYRFSDEEFTKLYHSEQVVSQLSNIFAILAIFISCLGLFGLATFTAAQRTREIGVRKVLGASVSGIIGMLSGSFLKLIMLAMLLAFPLSWLAMKSWLQQFAYQSSLEWWIFGLAGLLTAVIAMLTVSFQSIKAAIANPIKSLRTE